MITEQAPLTQRVLAGETRAAARLITLIEDGHPAASRPLAELFPHTGRAVVVGITGPPGVGKSTLVAAMVRVWRESGRTVGVLAVDPSSPFTGGAILGDRIRMSVVACDSGVFIRSMATRAHLGGLAEATPAAIRVLDALGLDIVLVETVGVGQSEVTIADAADCTVLVTMPGCGDEIQIMKAGILEIGNVFVVNKADRDGAQRTQSQLKAMVRLQDRATRPAVLLTRADVDEGVLEVVQHVDAFVTEHQNSGRLDADRQLHLRREALQLIGAQASRDTLAALDEAKLSEFTDALRTRQLDVLPTEVGYAGCW